MQLAAVRRVLLSERKMEATRTHLQLPGERRRGEVGFLDGNAFLVADAEDEVPAKIRIDVSAKRELDLSHVEAASRFERAAVRARIGDDVGNDADARIESGVVRLLRLSGRHAAHLMRGPSFPGYALELSHESDRVRSRDAVRARHGIAACRRIGVLRARDRAGEGYQRPTENDRTHRAPVQCPAPA